MRVGLLVAGLVSVLMATAQTPAPAAAQGHPPVRLQPEVTPAAVTDLLTAREPIAPPVLGPQDPRTPRADAPLPGTAHVDCRRHKCIALTLDDGPSPQTGRILDELARLEAPATFFVIGNQAVHYPTLLRRMVAEGHTIGNHSWSHPWFWKLAPAAMRSQLDATDAAIRKITGAEPKYVRPPYGNVNGAVEKAAKSRGLAIIDWSIDPEDWKVRNTTTVVERVVAAARPGAIILSHDLYPTTRKAIGPIIERLRAKGYTFVSLDDLLGRTRPGKVYRQR